MKTTEKQPNEGLIIVTSSKNIKKSRKVKYSRFISTSEAAKMAKVTSNTIQNLCKNGYLSYTKKGPLYMINRADVKKYKNSIRDIHSATEDIEYYKQQLKEDAEQMKIKAEEFRKMNELQLENLKMCPERIGALLEFCQAVLANLNKDTDISSRELDILKHIILYGKSFKEYSEERYMTIANSKRIWFKALRGIIAYKGEIVSLNKQISILETEAKKYRRTIRELEGIIKEESVEEPDEESRHWKKMHNLLNSRVDELDLSLRSLNCLRSAEIETFKDLVKSSPSILMKYRNFGKKSLEELQDLLEDKGLAFGMDVQDYV